MAKRLPDHWKQTYCAFIAEGYTRSDAAKATGVATGTVDRHQSEDPEFRELYVQARESVRDTLRNDIWKLRHSENESTARWAYDHLIKWNLPEARDAQRLEVDVSGRVELTHERRLTLADLISAGRSIPGLVAGARGELSAAGEVLAESDESLATASDLPVRPAS